MKAAKSPTGASLRQALTEGRRTGARFQMVRQTINELKKVVWPTREDTTRLTMVVVSISVTMGILLGLLDLGFSKLVGAFFF